MSLLDRSSMAGSITSRIDHQHAVAVYIALSILAEDTMFGVALNSPDGAVIHCEGRDDLELVTPQTRCLISVKARSGDLSLVANEYARLLKGGYADPSRIRSCALVMLGPQPVQLTTFAQQLIEVKSLLAHRDTTERVGIYAGFSERWPDVNKS